MNCRYVTVSACVMTKESLDGLVAGINEAVTAFLAVEVGARRRIRCLYSVVKK